MTTRNLITEEIAERSRTVGGYTFNAFPPDGYNGIVFVFACVRLGDHAHVEVQSGRWVEHPNRQPGDALSGNASVGLAGRLCLRWHEWITLRGQLDEHTPHRIAEVEKPTNGQLDRYVTFVPPGRAADSSRPDVGEQIFK